MGSLSQFWGKRALPAAKAAVSSLQLIHDGQSIQILVLSKASLDCWQVRSANSQATCSFYQSALPEVSKIAAAFWQQK